jgi:hypothetical protein
MKYYAVISGNYEQSWLQLDATTVEQALREINARNGEPLGETVTLLHVIEDIDVTERTRNPRSTLYQVGIADDNAGVAQTLVNSSPSVSTQIKTPYPGRPFEKRNC